MLAVVAQIDGWDPVARAAVTITAASHDDAAVCHLNGQTWWPSLVKLPTLRYDLFDGAFAGKIVAPSSSLSMRTEPWPDFGRYSLAGARIRLWVGELGAAWDAFTLRFDGRLSNQPAIADGQASVEFAVDDSWLDTALLATYAGTTGAEGPAELKGQVKPLAVGRPRYVAGTLIDSVNSVFQVSNGPVVAIEAALEKLARFGDPVADYATYADLVAATIAPGKWATACAIGMARFGAPPEGQVSFLVSGDNVGGWARLPGAVIRRIAAKAGGAARVAAATLVALDVARPYPVSVYLDQQTTARDIIQNIAASVNAVVGVSWTGQLFALPIAIGAATMTLAADGSSLPPVEKVEQVEIATPWQKLTVAAERAWTVHALADIAFTATLVDRGRYSAEETYREGNIVDLADGSRWLFQATTPAIGQAPAEGSAYWTNINPPTKAADIAYADGSTVEDFKPAEPGATAGAPPGTPVGDLTSDSVAEALRIMANVPTGTEVVAGARALVERLRLNQTSALAAQLLAQARKQAADVMLHLEGVPLGTRVRQEINERIEGDAVIVERLVELTAKTENDVGEILAAIVEEARVRADADSAETEQREAAISSVTGLVDGERTAREAAIVEEQRTRADAISAETEQREAAISSVTGLVDGERTAREAAIDDERLTRADEVGAVARSVQNLGTVVDDQSASVSFLLEAIDGKQAVAQIVTNVNGQITGFRINGQESSFVIAADRFVVGNDAAFEVVNGETRIRRLLIGSGNIGFDELLIASLVRRGFDSSDGGTAQSFGSTVQLADFSVPLGTINPAGTFTAKIIGGPPTPLHKDFVTTMNGKPAYFYYQNDGGFQISCTDLDGNTYAFGGDRYLDDRVVRATKPFPATFVATIQRGDLDTGWVDDGDYYIRRVSQQYAIGPIDVELTWRAL